MQRKRLLGIIVSDKMAKTVVVEAANIKRHKKYKKQYTVHTSYKAHDENGDYRVGDVVEIEESKPLSKEKRWRVIKKIK